MDPRIYSTPILILLVFVLPLFGKWNLLFSWPALVALLAGVVLVVSQPPVRPEALQKKTSTDRWSVLILEIAGCLVFLVPLLDYRFGREARPLFYSPWSIVGVALSGIGLSFRYWSIRTLGKFFTTVVKVQKGQHVIQRGPYRYLRHPSYLGALVMAVGVSVVLRSYIGLVFVLVGFLGSYVYRISIEEKTMLGAFGEEYSDYQKRTWRIIPFLY